MISDVALLVKDDLEAIEAAAKSRNHRDLSNAHKQQVDSRNWLYLRYGRDGVAEYIRQLKEATYENSVQVRQSVDQKPLAHC